MLCKKCENDKDPLTGFYRNDKTCKECRKQRVKENRDRKIEYYRAYDKKRYKEDPKVRARHKRYQSTPEGLASANKAKRKWSENNLKKRWCSHALNNAVRDGHIKKASSCISCGKSGVRIEGHHPDYNRPLDVIWLCSKCHREWHRENGEGLNA